jgi:hypothetical protein
MQHDTDSICNSKAGKIIIIIKQLAKHFTTGEPFDLGGVKFEYWR